MCTKQAATQMKQKGHMISDEEMEAQSMFALSAPLTNVILEAMMKTQADYARCDFCSETLIGKDAFTVCEASEEGKKMKNVKEHVGHTSCGDCKDSLSYFAESGRCKACWTNVGRVTKDKVKFVGAGLQRPILNQKLMQMVSSLKTAEESKKQMESNEMDNKIREQANNRAAAAAGVRQKRIEKEEEERKKIQQEKEEKERIRKEENLKRVAEMEERKKLQKEEEEKERIRKEDHLKRIAEMEEREKQLQQQLKTFSDSIQTKETEEKNNKKQARKSKDTELPSLPTEDHSSDRKKRVYNISDEARLEKSLKMRKTQQDKKEKLTNYDSVVSQKNVLEIKLQKAVELAYSLLPDESLKGEFNRLLGEEFKAIDSAGSSVDVLD